MIDNRNAYAHQHLMFGFETSKLYPTKKEAV